MPQNREPLPHQSIRHTTLLAGGTLAFFALGSCLWILNGRCKAITDDTHEKVATVMAGEKGSTAKGPSYEKGYEESIQKIFETPPGTTTLADIESKLTDCDWQCRLRPQDTEVRCTLPEEAGFGSKNYLFIAPGAEKTLMIARNRKKQPLTMVDSNSTCDQLTDDVVVAVQHDNHFLMEITGKIITDTGFLDFSKCAIETETCFIDAELLPLDCGRYRGWFTDAKKVGEGEEYQATVSDFSIEIPPTADEVTVEFHAVQDDGTPVPHNNGWTKTLNPYGLPDFITTILESREHGIELSVDRTGCPE